MTSVFAGGDGLPAGTGGTPDMVSVDISSLLPADEVTVHLSVTSTVDEQLTPAPVFLIDTVAVVLTVDETTTTDSFTYDAAGRMLTRDVDGTVTTLEWDASSNLTSATADGEVTVYAYDAGGQRVAQATLAAGTDPGTASAYVAGMELTDPNTAVADNVTGTRFYTFGGATVAVRTAQGLSLLLGDEQGSAQIMMPLRTDPATGALLPATQADADATERTAYAPYGARRGDDLEDINRGWLGQVEDTGTGLTYLNARYYDPAIGRFLSPDPLMNPGDPRTLDPYRYADNNPITFHDATGLSPACFGLKGDASQRCWDNYSFNARDGYKTYIAFTKQQLKYAKLSPEDRRATRSGYTNYYGGGHSPVRSDNSGRTHTTLDVVGLLPVVGEPADLTNAALYASEGRWGHAGLSGLGAIPVFGWFATAFKGTLKSSPSPNILQNKINGDAARDTLLAKYPGAGRDEWLPTTNGYRSVDILAGRHAIEVKSGYTSLTSSITEQIAKDVALRADGEFVESLEWAFVRSPATNQVGPSKPLLAALHNAGITVKIDGVTIQPPPTVG